MRRPVLLPACLAILSVIVMPVFFFCQLGLNAIDLLGLLSIFRSTSVVLGVVQDALSLVLLWGTIYLLWIFGKALPREISPRSLRILLTALTYIAVLTSVLTPLGSVMNDSLLFGRLNTLTSFCAMVVSVALGISILRAARLRRNALVFGIGLALSVCTITNYSGNWGGKFLSELSSQNVAEESFEDSDAPESESLLWSLWGLSSADVDNLDDETVANMQEVSFALIGLGAALAAGWTALYAASSALFFGLLAVYFVRKKRNLSC